MPKTLKTAVIGCGLIGSRRAEEAATHKDTELTVVVDSIPEKTEALKQKYGCRSTDKWNDVIEDQSVDVIVVATPNGYTSEIGGAALSAGKHVLVEKPPGRNVKEAKRLAQAAKKSGTVLKIGFNHRYHPALKRAYTLYREGTIGKLINIRARYGHGGRLGYEKEWRGDARLAGGGELTDQGVHITDLIHWFAGLPSQSFAKLQTAVWPIRPLEDNAFGLFLYPEGMVASFHTSWTQWKNLFSFEIFGDQGCLTIEGLGGSYGIETLAIVTRKPEGGIPQLKEERFEGPDLSWKIEWEQFISSIKEGTPYWGTPNDGVVAMTMVDSLYRSSTSGTVVQLGKVEA